MKKDYLESNPGKAKELNQEEVKQNERDRIAKFREFEKLRRSGTAEEPDAKANRNESGTSKHDSSTELQGPELLLDNANIENERTKRNHEKSIQLIEPTDFSDK